MDQNIVPVFSERQLIDILSCVQQNIRTGFTVDTTTPFTITVWFPDIANILLKSNTPNGAFCVRQKKLTDYSHPDLIIHIKNIWNNSLIPIEIIQKDGAIFYALPKTTVLSNFFPAMIRLLPAEENIPTIDDFFF
jgi:hypothetical protein